MTPEGDDDRLLLGRKARRARLLRPDLEIGDGGPLFSLGDRFRIDAIAFGELPQARLTISLDAPPLSLWRTREESGP